MYLNYGNLCFYTLMPSSLDVLALVHILLTASLSVGWKHTCQGYGNWHLGYDLVLVLIMSFEIGVCYCKYECHHEFSFSHIDWFIGTL